MSRDGASQERFSHPPTNREVEVWKLFLVHTVLNLVHVHELGKMGIKDKEGIYVCASGGKSLFNVIVTETLTLTQSDKTLSKKYPKTTSSEYHTKN